MQKLIRKLILQCFEIPPWAQKHAADASSVLTWAYMQVARSTWRLVTKHVSVCARCNLLGCWAHCEGCKTTSYCSAKCQR